VVKAVLDADVPPAETQVLLRVLSSDPRIASLTKGPLSAFERD
jgi:hypothetical protein